MIRKTQMSTNIKKPFTGSEATRLAFLARFPKSEYVDEVIEELDGRAKEVALALVGINCLTEETKTAVESLQKWAKRLKNER